MPAARGGSEEALLAEALAEWRVRIANLDAPTVRAALSVCGALILFFRRRGSNHLLIGNHVDIRAALEAVVASPLERLALETEHARIARLVNRDGELLLRSIDVVAELRPRLKRRRIEDLGAVAVVPRDVQQRDLKPSAVRVVEVPRDVRGHARPHGREDGPAVCAEHGRRQAPEAASVVPGRLRAARPRAPHGVEEVVVGARVRAPERHVRVCGSQREQQQRQDPPEEERGRGGGRALPVAHCRIDGATTGAGRAAGTCGGTQQRTRWEGTSRAGPLT